MGEYRKPGLGNPEEGGPIDVQMNKPEVNMEQERKEYEKVIEINSEDLLRHINEVEITIRSEHTPLVQLEKIRFQLEQNPTIKFRTKLNYDETDLRQVLLDSIDSGDDIDLLKAA